MFGLIKKYDVHMCSEVKGVLTLNGEPIEGALINRHLNFAHKLEKDDEVRTASDGSFYLPEVIIESKIPGDMFSHDVTYQRITAVYKDEEYELWNSKFTGISELNEYKQKLACLNGDLASSEVNFVFPNNSNEHLEFNGSGICRWENDFETYEVEDSEDYFKDFR